MGKKSTDREGIHFTKIRIYRADRAQVRQKGPDIHSVVAQSMHGGLTLLAQETKEALRPNLRLGFLFHPLQGIAIRLTIPLFTRRMFLRKITVPAPSRIPSSPLAF